MMSCFVNYREHTLRAGATGAKVWGELIFTLKVFPYVWAIGLTSCFYLQVCGVLGLSAWRVTRCTDGVVSVSYTHLTLPTIYSV